MAEHVIWGDFPLNPRDNIKIFLALKCYANIILGLAAGEAWVAEAKLLQFLLCHDTTTEAKRKLYEQSIQLDHKRVIPGYSRYLPRLAEFKAQNALTLDGIIRNRYSGQDVVD